MSVSNSKRKIAFFIVLLCILCMPLTAFAADYVTDSFSIRIPDGGNVYYMTPEGTNMKDDMLAAAKDEQNIQVLTGVYTSAGDLAYTLKFYKQPLTDAQAMLQELKIEMEKDYAFGDSAEETIDGHTAFVISGDSLKDPMFASKIYAFSDENFLYTVNIVYRKADNNQYLNDANAQLATLKINPASVESAVPSASPSVSPTISPSAPVASAPQSAKAQTEIVELTPPLQNPAASVTVLWKDWLLLIVAIVALVLLITFICVLVSYKKKKKQWIREQFPFSQEYWKEEQLQQNATAAPYQIPTAQPIQLSQPINKERPMSEDAYPRAEQILQEPSNEKPIKRDANADMLAAYELKKRGDYILAAQKFHTVVGYSNDKMISKFADMQIVECFIAAKQYHAALLKANKILYKDYDYTVEGRRKLEALIATLKKNNDA
ncbi:MAG: hypothetical protein RR449_03795 [Christensenella sp.]